MGKESYSYQLFLEKNEQQKGRPNVITKLTVVKVNLKENICIVQKPCTTLSYKFYIKQIVEDINKGIANFYISNPSVLKNWKGFSNVVNGYDLTQKQLNQVILTVKEPYVDIVNAMGFPKEKYDWSLCIVNGDIVFNGKVDGIDLKQKLFTGRNTTEEQLVVDIKCWLFDTLDTLLNVF